jgi:hypothetical protein
MVWVAFSSSESLSNVNVWVTPELQPYIQPKLSGFCWPVISQFIQHKIRHILEISKIICKQ